MMALSVMTFLYGCGPFLEAAELSALDAAVALFLSFFFAVAAITGKSSIAAISSFFILVSCNWLLIY